MNAKTDEVAPHGPILCKTLRSYGVLSVHKLRARDLAANRCLRHARRNRERREFVAKMENKDVEIARLRDALAKAMALLREMDSYASNRWEDTIDRLQSPAKVHTDATFGPYRYRGDKLLVPEHDIEAMQAEIARLREAIRKHKSMYVGRDEWRTNVDEELWEVLDE